MVDERRLSKEAIRPVSIYLFVKGSVIFTIFEQLSCEFMVSRDIFVEELPQEKKYSLDYVGV